MTRRFDGPESPRLGLWCRCTVGYYRCRSRWQCRGAHASRTARMPQYPHEGDGVAWRVWMQRRDLPRGHNPAQRAFVIERTHAAALAHLREPVALP